MRYSVVAVVVLSVVFRGEVKASSEEVDGAPSVNYKGLCAYPCSMQNRNYQRVENFVGVQGVRNSSDPTIFSLIRNDTVLLAVIECIMRSGPFVMSRQEIEGNTTHALYRCSKYMFDDENGDIITVIRTTLEVHKNYPSICDICNGEGFEETFVMKDENVDCRVVIVPDMGCNLPLVCPVTNPDVQVQCTCADETFDSGFCCP